MKHFILVNSENLEFYYSYEADVKQLFGGAWGSAIHLEVPEELDHETVKCESYEDTETIVISEEQIIPAVTEERAILDVNGEPVLNEFGEPTYETVVISEEQIIPAVTEERTFTNYRLVTDEDKVAAKALRTKQELVSQAYAAMDKDLFDECEAVFNTRRFDSAMTTHSTWKEMAEKPEDYLEMFPTVEAVIEYVTPRLLAARRYSMYRLQRMAQFEAEKAAILSQ